MQDTTHNTDEYSTAALRLADKAFEHTLNPTHHIAFPGSSSIFAVEFSPDGKVAYCAVDADAIDLWSLGLSRWPETLGGTLALLVLIYLLILSRVIRRPQTKGEPYCARCNYHLQAHAPATKDTSFPQPTLQRCPECGLDTAIKKPKRGKSHLRRLWLPTTLTLLFAGAYAYLFAAGVPRSATAPNPPAIWSAWINDYAQRTQAPWLIKHQTPVTRLMTVDTQSGSITGCLRTMRMPLAAMKVSPDGRFLAITEAVDTLAWIRTDTGRTVSTTSGGHFWGSGMDEGFILKVTGSQTNYAVYFKAVDQRTATSRLLMWNPQTGAQRILVEEPAYVRRNNNLYTRRYALIECGSALATISAPDFLQSYEEKMFTITVRAPSKPDGSAGPIERFINVPNGEQCCSSPLVAAPDGSMMFLKNYRSIIGYNANTGESLGELAPPTPYDTSPDQMLLHQGRIYTGAYPDAILIRDIENRAWLACLKVPTPFMAPELSVSANSRWLAAVPFRKSGAAPNRPYIHELFLYDLTPTNSPPAKAETPR